MQREQTEFHRQYAAELHFLFKFFFLPGLTSLAALQGSCLHLTGSTLNIPPPSIHSFKFFFCLKITISLWVFSWLRGEPHRLYTP